MLDPGTAAAVGRRVCVAAGEVGELREVARRQWLCAGLEWLSGLLYWQQVGDTAMFADYRRRLAQWLRSIRS